MEMIQNAYQGFAKQNYTMLDNLKLGYGGTKKEMKRLIKDAAKLDKSIKKNDLSFSNIVKAINVVQTEMGITGTTALEAGRTISGSVGAMKSAWTNLVTGLADGNADIGQLVDNLVTTIVGDGTESNLGVLGNVMPAVKTALSGASKLVSELLPKIVQGIPSIINDNLPILAEAAISIIQSLVDGISQNQEMLMKTAFDTIAFLANSLISMLPQIVALGLDLIVSLANGIVENLDTLTQTIIDVVLRIGEILTNPDNLGALIEAAIEIIVALSEGIAENFDVLIPIAFDLVQEIVNLIIENAPELATAAFGIINEFGNALAQEIPGLSWVFENLETAIVAVTAAVVAYKGAMEIVGIINSVKNAITAFKVATEGQTIAQTLLNAVMKANPFVLVATLVTALVAAIITLWNTNEGFRNALINAWEAIKSAANTIFTSVANFFTETIPNAFNDVINWFDDIGEKFADIGGNIIDGIKQGISDAWKSLVTWFEGLFGDLIGIAKKILGIASPSKVFKKIGGFTAEGFGIGFDDEFSRVKDDMDKALTFDDYSTGINASVKKIGSGQNTFGGSTSGISIVQNIYSKAQTAADLMQEARYQSEQAVFLSV